jgi:hypothetical protein
MSGTFGSTVLGHGSFGGSLGIAGAGIESGIILRSPPVTLIGLNSKISALDGVEINSFPITLLSLDSKISALDGVELDSSPKTVINLKSLVSQDIVDD